MARHTLERNARRRPDRELVRLKKFRSWPTMSRRVRGLHHRGNGLGLHRTGRTFRRGLVHFRQLPMTRTVRRTSTSSLREQAKSTVGRQVALQCEADWSGARPIWAFHPVGGLASEENGTPRSMQRGGRARGGGSHEAWGQVPIKITSGRQAKEGRDAQHRPGRRDGPRKASDKARRRSDSYCSTMRSRSDRQTVDPPADAVATTWSIRGASPCCDL